MAKTYTTVPDKASGDLFTETMWDTHIRENINNILTPPAVRAVRSTTQTVSAGTTATIDFTGTDTFDTDAMHDPASNSTRITFNTAGIYIVTARLTWAAISTAASSERNTRIRLNGTSIIAGQSHKAASADNQTIVSTVSITYAFAVNDYIELLAFNGDSASKDVDIDATFAAVWTGRSS